MELSKYAELRDKKLCSVSKTVEGIVIASKRFDPLTGEQVADALQVLQMSDLQDEIDRSQKNLDSIMELKKDVDSTPDYVAPEVKPE